MMATKTEMVRETDFPSYIQMVMDVYETCEFNWKGFNGDILNYPYYFKGDLMKYAYVSSTEVTCVVVIAIILTVFRYILTALIFRVSA